MYSLRLYSYRTIDKVIVNLLSKNGNTPLFQSLSSISLHLEQLEPYNLIILENRHIQLYTKFFREIYQVVVKKSSFQKSAFWCVFGVARSLSRRARYTVTLIELAILIKSINRTNLDCLLWTMRKIVFIIVFGFTEAVLE